MSPRYRPLYLAHIGVLRWRPGESEQRPELRKFGTWRVVLRPSGRQHVPEHFLRRVGRGDTADSDLPPGADIDLGLVAPRALADDPPARQRVSAWGFNRWEHPDRGGSGAYATRREAVESCAVEAIDGSAARQRFNVERSRRRRRNSP